MRNLQAGEESHLHVFAFECVGRSSVLFMTWNWRQPNIYRLTGLCGLHHQVSRGVFQVIGAGVNLTILYGIVGNELGQPNRGFRVEWNSFIEPNCDVSRGATIARGSGEH